MTWPSGKSVYFLLPLMPYPSDDSNKIHLNIYYSNLKIQDSKNISTYSAYFTMTNVFGTTDGYGVVSFTF